MDGQRESFPLFWPSSATMEDTLSMPVNDSSQVSQRATRVQFSAGQAQVSALQPQCPASIDDGKDLAPLPKTTRPTSFDGGMNADGTRRQRIHRRPMVVILTLEELHVKYGVVGWLPKYL